jgi:hypothetical protein
LAGSGKNTAAQHLVDKHNYVSLSFAATVKDCLSVIFHWDRNLLEGTTVESREWREKVDTFWSKKLKIKNFTPRYAMQHIGTDLFREKFNDSIWIYSLEKKILEMDQNIVISDCRFYNECAMLKSNGAILVRITKEQEPDWYGIARSYPSKMRELYPSVHASEYSWASVDFDYIIDNTSDLETFLNQIDTLNII